MRILEIPKLMKVAQMAMDRQKWNIAAQAFGDLKMITEGIERDQTRGDLIGMKAEL